MTQKVFDRVQEKVNSTGTGDIGLNGAVSGFRAFGSVYSDGDTLEYCWVDPSTGTWEVGVASYAASANKLQRQTISANSAGTTAALSLSGNAAVYVFVTLSAASIATMLANEYDFLPDLPTITTLLGTHISPLSDPSGALGKATLLTLMQWMRDNDGSVDPKTLEQLSGIPNGGFAVLGYRLSDMAPKLLLSTAIGGGSSGGGSVPVNSAVPTISGTAQVGQTLTGNHGTWSNSPTGYDYAWKSNGTTVATTQNYTPVVADIGNTLTFTETAKNAAGSGTAATSSATSAVIAASSGGGTSFDKTNGNFKLYYDMRTVTSGTIQNLANPGTGDLVLGGGVAHNTPVSDFTGLVGASGAGMSCSQTAAQIGWDANNTKAWVMELYSFDNQTVEGLFTIAGLTGSAGDYGYNQGGNMDPTIYNNNQLDTGGYYQGIGFSAGFGGYADTILRMVWVQEDATNWKAFVKGRRAGQAWSAATVRDVQTGTLSKPFVISATAPIKFFNTSNQYAVVGMIGMISGAITDAQATALMNNPYQPIGG